MTETDESEQMQVSVKDALEDAHSLIVYFGNAHGSMESEHGRKVHKEVSRVLNKIDTVLDAKVQPSPTSSRIAELEAALREARRQLITLGGDHRPYPDAQSTDTIHGAVLDQIDAALSSGSEKGE